MERHFVRLTLFNIVIFYTLQLGCTHNNYKIFPGKAGGGCNLKAFSSIASAEDCSAVCTHTDTCLSATFKASGPGHCRLFSSINTHMWGNTDYSATHVEIDVLKGNYGCYSEREINTDSLECACKRNASGIYCETINSCPVSKGYKTDRQKCFKYVTEEKKQSDAHAACVQEGGHLFTLENADDIAMLIAEANCYGAASNAMSWIDGGQHKRTWNGEPLPWESWAPGSGDPPCVSLCHHDRLMEDWGCVKGEGYFCQIDI